jgi:replication factor C subunit 2/4
MSEDEIENTISDKEDDKSESEEMIYKKRGPKRKGVRKNNAVSFKLENSNDESSEEQEIKTVQKGINQKNNKSTLSTPWIEKYRPVKVEDLVLDINTHNKIKKIITDKIMPNIIITGIPGVGKTTTILCIAKNLLGKYFSEGVLELNASDERGVKTVHQTIEYFCKKSFGVEGNLSKHKLVLLDEADNMTKKAQQSINVLIDQFRDTTRFAFTCNNSSQIIEAIQSRCIIFRYGRLDNSQITNRLKHICDIEKVPYTNDGLNAIVTTAQGDLRQAINNLQLTFNGYIDITPENVYRLCDKPHPLIIQNIFIACSKKDIRNALMLLNDLNNKGYSSLDISFSMLNTLKNISNTIIDERTKIMYMEEISKACLVINRGINTPLQLSGTIASLCK